MTLAAIIAVAAEIVPGEAFGRTTLGNCHHNMDIPEASCLEGAWGSADCFPAWEA